MPSSRQKWYEHFDIVFIFTVNALKYQTLLSIHVLIPNSHQTYPKETFHSLYSILMNLFNECIPYSFAFYAVVHFLTFCLYLQQMSYDFKHFIPYFFA